MTSLKSSFESLAPIAYDELPSGDELPGFVKDSFAHAEHLLNSIPTPASHSVEQFEPKPANTARKAVDTSCDPSSVPAPSFEQDLESVKAWGKPYKMSTKDNPLAVQVYKMAAHDRHGAWFARRSIHQGIGFEKWKAAASHEFLESLKVQEGPGAGAVRGVAADRRVEKLAGPHNSTIEVWQTSSAFPGPVTPRTSLVLLISSSSALSRQPDVSDADGGSDALGGGPRHWLVLSRPTRHADVPDRPNLVKMEYESTEMIREIPIKGNSDPESNPVEWTMVTRSDPGGGIPRFMVERGTPGSIVADVTKFLNWATSKGEAELGQDGHEDAVDAVVEQQNQQLHRTEHEPVAVEDSARSAAVSTQQLPDSDIRPPGVEHHGYYDRFSEAVGSAVSGYLPVFQQQSAVCSTDQLNKEESSSDISDSSDSTFRSALHHQRTSELGQGHGLGAFNDSDASLPRSSTTGEDKHSRNTSKELDKLLHKRAALDEKARKERDTFAHKAAQANEKDEKERIRMMDKHEKQRKKQEERYNRELAKLDERRIKEERREEARRKKTEEKDTLKRLKQEVSEWKNRCQVAEEEADLLRKQVENLQRENINNVAQLPEDEAKSILNSSKNRSRASSLKPESAKSGKSATSGQ